MLVLLASHTGRQIAQTSIWRMVVGSTEHAHDLLGVMFCVRAVSLGSTEHAHDLLGGDVMFTSSLLLQLPSDVHIEVTFILAMKNGDCCCEAFLHYCDEKTFVDSI